MPNIQDSYDIFAYFPTITPKVLFAIATFVNLFSLHPPPNLPQYSSQGFFYIQALPR